MTKSFSRTALSKQYGLSTAPGYEHGWGQLRLQLHQSQTNGVRQLIHACRLMLRGCSLGFMVYMGPEFIRRLASSLWYSQEKSVTPAEMQQLASCMKGMRAAIFCIRRSGARTGAMLCGRSSASRRVTIRNI